MEGENERENMAFHARVIPMEGIGREILWVEEKPSFKHAISCTEKRVEWSKTLNPKP
jgi:hypothetical protein